MTPGFQNFAFRISLSNCPGGLESVFVFRTLLSKTVPVDSCVCVPLRRGRGGSSREDSRRRRGHRRSAGGSSGRGDGEEGRRGCSLRKHRARGDAAPRRNRGTRRQGGGGGGCGGGGCGRGAVDYSNRVLCSLLFPSVPFCSRLFPSVLFLYSLLFSSILLRFISCFRVCTPCIQDFAPLAFSSELGSRHLYYL